MWSRTVRHTPPATMCNEPDYSGYARIPDRSHNLSCLSFRPDTVSEPRYVRSVQYSTSALHASCPTKPGIGPFTPSTPRPLFLHSASVSTPRHPHPHLPVPLPSCCRTSSAQSSVCSFHLLIGQQRSGSVACSGLVSSEVIPFGYNGGRSSSIQLRFRRPPQLGC